MPVGGLTMLCTSVLVLGVDVFGCLPGSSWISVLMPRKKSSVENDFEPVFWKPWFQVLLSCCLCKGKVLLLGWMIELVVIFQLMPSTSSSSNPSSLTIPCSTGKSG